MPALPSVDHRGLFGLAWPILVSMLSYTMLSVVNSVYVGWLGTSELAAIGLSSSLVFLVLSFPQGLLSGVRVLVANRTGAARPDEARAVAWLGLGVALALGVLAIAFGPLGVPALRLLGASPDVADHGADYFAWRVASAPLLFLLVALTGAFQGGGDTRSPMVANVLANVVNLVVDPALIFGFGPIPAYGLAGAGMGCAIGIAAGLAFLALRSGRVLGAFARPTRAGLAELWRVGAPSGVHWLLDVGSYVLLTALLADAGEAHLAAHVIVVRIVMVSFLPCHAIGEATSVLVGQSTGAGAPDLARRALRLGLVQATSLMAALAGAYVLAPAPLVAVFGAAPDVVAIATPILVLYGLVQVVDGALIVMYGALTGAGDTRFAMRAGLLAAWAVKLPVAGVAVLALSLGAFGAWLGIGAEILFAAGLAAWRVAGRRWLAAPAPRGELVAAK